MRPQDDDDDEKEEKIMSIGNKRGISMRFSMNVNNNIQTIQYSTR